MKRTKWFSGFENPFHVGVYERMHPVLSQPILSHWNGYNWACSGIDAREALLRRGTISDFQLLPWRGLDK